jgi:hypothetical protein
MDAVCSDRGLQDQVLGAERRLADSPAPASTLVERTHLATKNSTPGRPMKIFKSMKLHGCAKAKSRLKNKCGYRSSLFRPDPYNQYVHTCAPSQPIGVSRGERPNPGYGHSPCRRRTLSVEEVNSRLANPSRRCASPALV